MLTLRQQLKDPVYRKWFATPPKSRPSAARTPEWYIYIQPEAGGPWKRGEAKTYIQAYKYVAKNIKKYHDMAISHKRATFKPPVVRDKTLNRKRYHIPKDSEPHTFWCGFCRRVTKFRYYAKHHAMPGLSVDDSERRCMICGARKSFATKY